MRLRARQYQRSLAPAKRTTSVYGSPADGCLWGLNEGFDREVARYECDLYSLGQRSQGETNPGWEVKHAYADKYAVKFRDAPTPSREVPESDVFFACVDGLNKGYNGYQWDATTASYIKP
jgi:hypothetical protein